jgi:hypothetical protein
MARNERMKKALVVAINPTETISLMNDLGPQPL